LNSFKTLKSHFQQKGSRELHQTDFPLFYPAIPISQRKGALDFGSQPWLVAAGPHVSDQPLALPSMRHKACRIV
jgi:hypothetical protein